MSERTKPAATKAEAAANLAAAKAAGAKMYAGRLCVRHPEARGERRTANQSCGESAAAAGRVALTSSRSSGGANGGA
jgi:hypothetical protein